LPDAAHLGAQMRRLQMDGDPPGLDQLCDRVGDLLAEALLHGEAAREHARYPGQLRDADDPLVRDVADMSEPVERQRVVLAERVEGDRPFDDLADEAVLGDAALGRESGQQLGIAVVAGGRVVERSQEALRRSRRAGRVEVHPERREDLRHRPLETTPFLWLDVPRRRPIPGALLARLGLDALHQLLSSWRFLRSAAVARSAWASCTT